MPRGIGSRCGVKTISSAATPICSSSSPVWRCVENAVRRKIVGRVHKVRLRRGRLSRAAHAALGVGHNAVLQIDQSRGNQRLQRQNDRCRVAAGIGNQPRAGNLLAMQLRHAVDSLRLRGRGQLASFVLKGVDGAVGRFGQPPRSAQIDHAQAALQRFRNPLARLLMRRGEKQHLHAALGRAAPRKTAPASDCRPSLLPAKLRMNLGQRNAAAREVLCLPRARQKPAACPSGADDATTAAPAPRRRTPSLPQPLFVSSSSCFQHRP